MHGAVLMSSLLLCMVSVNKHQHVQADNSRYRGPHHPRGQSVSSHQHYRPQRVAGAESDAAPKLTQDTNLLHDTDHIREDLGDWVSAEDTKKMTTEELEFHYFKLHDFDNNTKLDGLEILQAIHHTLHHDADNHEENHEENHNENHNENYDDGHKTDEKETLEELDPVLKQQNFDYFVELIDRVLEEDDIDNDGFLSYVEYVVGRQKDERNRQDKTKHATTVS